MGCAYEVACRRARHFQPRKSCGNDARAPFEALKGDVSGISTNPCGEILLRSKQFCNLSEVVARREDTEKDLLRKIRIATIIGTYQSTLRISLIYQKNGRIIAGRSACLACQLRDSGIRRSHAKHSTLKSLRAEAIKVNAQYAKKFGITASTSITCVKPSGTLSQLVDSSSGMHPRHSQYYIRRIRIAAHDPLSKMMKAQGVRIIRKLDSRAMTRIHMYWNSRWRRQKGPFIKMTSPPLNSLNIGRLRKRITRNTIRL